MERQNLLDLLSDAMRGLARKDLFGGKLVPGRVKSRLIEAHVPEASSDGVESLLRGAFADSGLSVKGLGEDLWSVCGQNDLLFVDSLNPRFWLLHSTAPSERLQRLLKLHVLPSSRLDRAWFSSQQLSEMEGERRWIRSSFSSDVLQPNGSGRLVPRRWRAQVEGEDPNELLELISTHERYQAGAALTAVGSRLGDVGGDCAEVAADYQGAFAASGKGFHLVAGMLWRILDSYEAYIQSLESSFRLGVTASEELGMSLEGAVATIDFPHEVADLDALVANLFTCKEPFRLWAVPREVRSGEWEANAVDLHVGHELRLELSARRLRVLLGPNTCGNTLARLLANLQHRFDARTHLPQPVAT